MGNVVKFLPLFYIVAGVAGVYLIIRTLKAGGELAGDALEAAQGGTTNIIERVFPLTNPNQFITYAVWFEDGKQHAVPGESVDKNGYFTRNDLRYRMLVDASGRKTAVRV